MAQIVNTKLDEEKKHKSSQVQILKTSVNHQHLGILSRIQYDLEYQRKINLFYFNKPWGTRES